MKPILFNTDMVRAILDGRKTVTRRVVKSPAEDLNAMDFVEMNGMFAVFKDEHVPPFPLAKAPYQSGDILYVRETWKQAMGDPTGGGFALFDTYVYKADGKAKVNYPIDRLMIEGRWHPSIHMPKEAARIFLRVTDVRVERLNKITVDGIVAELGEIVLDGDTNKNGNFERLPQKILRNSEKLPELSELEKFVVFAAMKDVWDSTIKPADRERYGWAASPWVWVIEFERCEKPEETTHQKQEAT